MTAGIVMMPLKDITPYEKNPRRNDDSVDAVANSIRDFGFRAPILVDKDHVIIAGHTRYKAARKLKLKTAPVVVCDDMTPEQVEAYRIADNSAGSASEWDYDLLGDILPTLEFDMADYGLDVVLEQMAEAEDVGEVIEDEPPEPDLGHEAIVKVGEMYRLGDHYLLCGDATRKEEIERLVQMGGGASGHRDN
mgnify:CR=1 FL=1